ncbi:hypothetical protein MUN81_06595 [Hymenobacter sp. 5317J-9]|uniref:hypothetical protein n=1 Tax=Hymenobacter sp. 5317J-9 TaxID=2932250 RepID=UPI001FD6FA20|nr:hypothetical protein [Hymenobacter sp. 5317J-9]UOQ99157.1 hypothetical protein MUN81_06595 [Hymenobacter sp. 5317J-9]
MKTLFSFCPVQFATRISAATPSAGLVLAGAMVLLGMGVAQPAAAQTLAQEPVQVSQPDSESLRVRISNPAQKSIVLRVVHLDNGRWVLNETHKVPAYGTRLRFNDLPTGRYAVMLQVGPERYRYTVDVDGQKPGASTIAVRELTTRRVENVVASAGM